MWKITTCEVRESDSFTIMIEPTLLYNFHLIILLADYKVLSSALPSIKNETSCSSGDDITYKANYLMFMNNVKHCWADYFQNAIYYILLVTFILK